MGSNLNVANITLNSSTEFVLQPANAASLQAIYHFLRFCDLQHRVVQSTIYCWTYILKLYAN